MEKKKIRLTCLLILFLIGGLRSTSAAEGAIQQKSVLVISSYSYEWTLVQDELRGITNAFAGAVQVNYMFMDTKVVDLSLSAANMDRKLETYYESGICYDAILAADDAAMQFVMEYRDAYFAGIPVVFLGLNSDSLAEEAVAQGNTTGVKEIFYIRDTVELARQILPQARQIVLITDSTISGRAVTAQAQAVENELGLPLVIMNCSELTREEIRQQIRAYDSSTILIYNECVVDADDFHYTEEEAIQMVMESAQIPVFSIDGLTVGLGAYAGAGVNFEQMGARAAEMVLEILDGTDISMMPVEYASRYDVADYQVLMSQGVSRSLFPEGTVFINQPNKVTLRDLIVANTYEAVMLAVMFFLIICIIFCILRIHDKKQKKKLELAVNLQKQNNERLRTVLTHSNMTTWKYVFATRQVFQDAESCKKHGYRDIVENVPESLIEDQYVHPTSADAYLEMYEKLRNGEPKVTGVFLVREAGRKGWWWEKITYLNTFDRNERPAEAIGFSTDVTAEVEKETELQLKAERDSLTGIYNRKTFENMADAYCKNAEEDAKAALFILDIDNFKLVNDSYGHKVGDETLIKIATILK